MPASFGGIAQLEEHLLCKQGVSGSNPLTSTSLCYGSGWQAGIIEISESEGIEGVPETKGFEKSFLFPALPD